MSKVKVASSDVAVVSEDTVIGIFVVLVILAILIPWCAVKKCTKRGKPGKRGPRGYSGSNGCNGNSGCNGTVTTSAALLVPVEQRYSWGGANTQAAGAEFAITTGFPAYSLDIVAPTTSLPPLAFPVIADATITAVDVVVRGPDADGGGGTIVSGELTLWLIVIESDLTSFTSNQVTMSPTLVPATTLPQNQLITLSTPIALTTGQLLAVQIRGDGLTAFTDLLFDITVQYTPVLA